MNVRPMLNNNANDFLTNLYGPISYMVHRKKAANFFIAATFNKLFIRSYTSEHLWLAKNP